MTSPPLTEMKWPAFVAWLKDNGLTFEDLQREFHHEFRGSRTYYRVFSPSLPKDFKGKAAKVRGWGDLLDVPPETKVHVLYDDGISARWVRLASIRALVWDVESVLSRIKTPQEG